MKWSIAFGWGIVIYAVMALVWSSIVLYGFSGTLVARVVELLVLIIVTTVAGRSLHFNSWKDIFPYSFLWAVIAVALDLVYNAPGVGWNISTDWKVWVGYALIVTVPLLAPMTRVRLDAGDHS